MFTKFKPLSVFHDLGVDRHDREGRVLTLEYEKFYLVACYTPNAGEGCKRIDYRVKDWDEHFFLYLQQLEDKSGKFVILAGDLNVAHKEIDVYEPKGHTEVPGFTK